MLKVVKPEMKDIPKARFEALAAYCRHPRTLFQIKEVRWLQSHDEAILVLITQDVEDGDFSAVLLARDFKERYRWVDMSGFFATPDEALAAAPALIDKVYSNFDRQRSQGDEKGKPVDFFAPIVPIEKLNKDFATVIGLEGYSPAVELMRPMMRWYEDADGNFVEQFQTTGFDTRIWELYLFAMLVEAGFAFDKEYAMPDFCARNAFGPLCIEATTVNPSRTRTGELIPPPSQETTEERIEFRRHYMPIRYAGPLTTKLAKKYLEKAHVKGKPLVFAIQDFHAPNSMGMSSTALPIYLYGMEWEWQKSPDDFLIITPKKIENHIWGDKIVQSGFFFLPDSKNVSAVITNANATISKFTRMGVFCGFGSDRVRLVRYGTAANPDPKSESPVEFVHDVNSVDYRETWIEGLDVYHNPNALYPLDPAMLPGAAHHRLLPDGRLTSSVPHWHPFGSQTVISVQE
jgi:hypothetical protein